MKLRMLPFFPVIAFVLLLGLVPGPSLSGESLSSSTVGKTEDQIGATGEFWNDFKNTGHLMWRGASRQFGQKTNLYYLGMGVPATWYAFEHDKRISNHYMTGNVPWYLNLAGDLGVVFNFPVVSIGLWYWGGTKGDSKLQNFAMELAATTYLTLVESGAMSYVMVHRRPNEQNLSMWETDFRGKSSFPSGHVVPYAALFFKTLQFYGPGASLGPFGLYVMASMQRIADGKHYLSDVVGAFFLAGIASEGVRAAANHNENLHPFYRWWAQHDVNIGISRVRWPDARESGPGVLMPTFSMTY